jgi:hypothetical protein
VSPWSRSETELAAFLAARQSASSLLDRSVYRDIRSFAANRTRILYMLGRKAMLCQRRDRRKNRREARPSRESRASNMVSEAVKRLSTAADWARTLTQLANHFRWPAKSATKPAGAVQGIPSTAGRILTMSSLSFSVWHCFAPHQQVVAYY